MTAALVLGQHVDLTLELGVGMDGAGLGKDLAALDLVALHTAQQNAHVVAGLGVIQGLAEHLDAGDDHLAGLLGQTDKLDLLAHLQLAALHTAGGHGAAAGDGHNVLNGHQEGQVSLALGSGDIAVDRVHELQDGGVDRVAGILAVALQSLQGGTLDDGGVVAGELILREQLADFHLNELQQLLVVHLVNLVHEHHDAGHAHLTGKQDVLAGLGHGAVGGGDHQDSAVHLSSAGDHVLNIVGVAGAVHVGIVPGVGLILDVSGVDGDAALALLRSLVDVGVIHKVGVALHSQHLGDGGGQGGLAMVNVADGADVYMGFVAFKFCLSHWEIASLQYKIYRTYLALHFTSIGRKKQG